MLFHFFALALSSVLLHADPIIVTGTDAGAIPQVNVFHKRTLEQLGFFVAYPTTMLGGVRVAAGDINGDGTPDIVTGAGAGSTEIRVFNGAAISPLGTTPEVLRSFFAFPGFNGGVFVAAGDLNGDGVADIIAGAGAGGGPSVGAFDGVNGDVLHQFLAYDPTFTGGVYVGAGDVNGDGFSDIITGAGAGGGPHVKVFDGRTLNPLASFFAFDPGFTGGVRVAAGDIDNDGRKDIITGTGVGGGHVRVFDGLTTAQLDSFFAFGPTFTGGVYVAGGSAIVSAGAGVVSTVNIYNTPGAPAAQSFQPFGGYQGGAFVAASDDVPEPSTVILLSLGGAALLLLKARRSAV